MSYKQFIVELEDDVLPAEAERRLMNIFKFISFSSFKCFILPCYEVGYICV